MRYIKDCLLNAKGCYQIVRFSFADRFVYNFNFLFCFVFFRWWLLGTMGGNDGQSMRFNCLLVTCPAETQSSLFSESHFNGKHKKHKHTPKINSKERCWYMYILYRNCSKLRPLCIWGYTVGCMLPYQKNLCVCVCAVIVVHSARALLNYIYTSKNTMPAYRMSDTKFHCMIWTNCFSFVFHENKLSKYSINIVYTCDVLY